MTLLFIETFKLYSQAFLFETLKVNKYLLFFNKYLLTFNFKNVILRLPLRFIAVGGI